MPLPCSGLEDVEIEVLSLGMCWLQSEKVSELENQGSSPTLNTTDMARMSLSANQTPTRSAEAQQAASQKN